MATKMKKGSGRKLSPEVTRLLQAEMVALTKQMTTLVEGKIDADIGRVRSDLENAMASIVGSIASGRLDARSIANTAARAFMPSFKDWLGQSMSQQGDGLLSIISKAQRNI